MIKRNKACRVCGRLSLSKKSKYGIVGDGAFDVPAVKPLGF